MGKGEVMITGSSGTVGIVLQDGLRRAGYSVRQLNPCGYACP
jgi:nucleoside-diphosphate-sugar epimerase